jgi:hypothetical protein
MLNPSTRTLIDKKSAMKNMLGSFISENTVDISKAVTMYLAISINHFPNSFFINTIFSSKQEPQADGQRLLP